jgi:hypothetical protein
VASSLDLSLAIARLHHLDKVYNPALHKVDHPGGTELKVKCYGATFRAKRTFALGRASIVRCGLNSVTAPSSTSGISLRTAQARARLPLKMSVMTREFLTTNELAATLGTGRELPRC